MRHSISELLPGLRRQHYSVLYTSDSFSHHQLASVCDRPQTRFDSTLSVCDRPQTRFDSTLLDDLCVIVSRLPTYVRRDELGILTMAIPMARARSRRLPGGTRDLAGVEKRTLPYFSRLLLCDWLRSPSGVRKCHPCHTLCALHFRLVLASPVGLCV